MKFIITESKLNLFKNKFLNDLLNNGVSKFDNFIVINNKEYDEFAEPNLEYDFSDGRLFIEPDLRQEFMDFFGTSKEETNDYISKWFGDKFEVTVEFTA